MAVQSILAGSDILLVCHEYEHMQEAYNGLYESCERRSYLKERLRRIGETDFAYENE